MRWRELLAGVGKCVAEGPQQSHPLSLSRGHPSLLDVPSNLNYPTLSFEHLETEDDVEKWLEATGKSNDSEGVSFALESIEGLRRDNIRVVPQVVPQDVQAISIAFSAAQTAAQMIFDRSWVLGTTTTPLVTSDEPVVPIGGPGSSRIEIAGIGTAGLVVMPLSPHHVLITVRPDLAAMLGIPEHQDRVEIVELNTVESIALSREIVMHAADQAYERPDQNLVRWLNIPSRPDDVSIDRFEALADGSEIIRTFNHTRWVGVELPTAWPLASFWHPAWSAYPIPSYITDRIEQLHDVLENG